VDVPELLRVLDFTPTPEDRLRSETSTAGTETIYQTPAQEFAVSVLTVDEKHIGAEIDVHSHHDGPQLLLCTEGAAVIYADDDKLTLERGAAAWVAAADGPIRLTAAEPTKLFRVTIGI
jgi:mannose-6-phosphate isomerase